MHILIFILSLGRAAEIRLPANPRFGVRDHLVYVLRTIPLAQLEVEPHALHVRGPLTIDHSDLDDDLRPKVRRALARVLAGEVEVSGVRLDFSRAQVQLGPQSVIPRIVTSPPLDGLPLPFARAATGPLERLPPLVQ